MTPRRCKHPFAAKHTHIAHVEVADFDEPQPMIYERCANCGTWLPLGPSSESEPEVKIELRAAELALNDGPIRTCDNAMPKDYEECGWDCWPFLNAMHDAAPAQWAGYLARQIHTHEEEGK
jgi:hypothetical protein